MNPTDSELLKRHQEGDSDAFPLIMKAYLKPIYHFAFHFTREEGSAEDIAQETFIKAWKHLDRFNAEKKFKTWIFAIAKNTAYDYLKKKRAIPFSSFEDDDGENPIEAIDDEKLLPDSLFEKKEIAATLAQALEQISPPNRAILTLRYLEDFSLEEISEILDEPYNTIKSRHGRALKSLKDVILRDDASQGTKAS
ncbi:MAG: sigma-70 family RNA polymerase sigma factor [Candidatus Moranbacteria bacterium]|jgi:RNA polymerase sigma-70 factor (ECF subfamily)|nr:sigma-70 family RNA polymerase sigma factor [Candidatus Moranbacteria bacterium]